MKQQPTGKGKALVSLLLSLTLLISVLCVPLSANAFAPQAGETVTYTFAKGQGNYGNVAAADGIGYGSWGMWPVYDKDGNGVLTQKIALNPKQTWATAGGIRLNNSDGFYELEPETTYAVTVKVRVLSAPALLADNKKNVSTAALAWGFEYNSSFSATNRINVTNHIDQAIYTAVSGSDTYTVTDLTGSKNYPYGENWHEAVYLITTPQDLGKGVAHFGLYVKSFTGLHSEIDEVSVTRLGAEDSAVVIVDEYSDEKSLLVGRIGEKVTLPSAEEMQQKAKDPTHIFEGWFTNEERTEPVGVSPEFENHSRQFYSRWKAPVTVTFHDDLTGTDVPVSGYAGSELTYPQDPTAPESAGKKWFIGWYTTAAATEEFKSTVFPGKNITVYAGYKGEVTDTAQGFESYEDIAKNEVVTVKDSKTGLMYKTYKRRGNFAIPFSLQSEEKAEGEKAVVFRWDSTRTFDIQNETDRENPEAYDAASAYNSRSNAFFLSEVPQKGETYTVTFRYKVAKANGQPKLQLYSSGPSNIWQDATLLGTALLDPAVDGQWKTGEALITVS